MSIAFYIFPAKGLKEEGMNVSISFTRCFIYANEFEEKSLSVKDKPEVKV